MVPIPLSEQTLQVASVTHARAVTRGYAQAQPVPIHAAATVSVANALRTRIVVRGTMEAVL